MLDPELAVIGVKVARRAAHAACRRWPWLGARLGADELTGRGCLAVVRCLKRYDGSKGEWLHLCRKAVARAMFNAVRAEGCPARDGRPVSIDGERKVVLTCRSRCEGEHARSREAAEALLDGLPADCREAVIAVVLDGRCQTALAAEWGVNKQTVHRTLRRAFKLVRERGEVYL